MTSPQRSKPAIKPWDCEGLRISVRGKTFRATGTLRVGQQSERVRETLGIIATKENKDAAEKEARGIVGRVRARLGGGVARKAVATLVAERVNVSGPCRRSLRFARRCSAQFAQVPAA